MHQALFFLIEANVVIYPINVAQNPDLMTKNSNFKLHN